MGLTAGNAAGFRGGVINTGVEDILVLPAVTVVSLLPGPALCDGFLHVLGLRSSPHVPASPLPAAAAAPFDRLVYSGAYLPFSLVLFHFARAALQFLRLSCECVFRLLSTTYTIDSPAVGSRCTDSRGSGGKLKLRVITLCQVSLLFDVLGLRLPASEASRVGGPPGCVRRG